MTFKEFLEYNFLNIGGYHLNLYHVLAAIVILVVARIILWLISRLAKRFFRKKQIDSGRQYATLQFVKYIIYTAAVLMAMEAMGISISLLMGGAAALLVGVGLGLQQTFNDLISGLILLVEGSVEVDDIIDVDGVIGRVISIGLRTSKIGTRDHTTIHIPNSKLVGDKSVNWSHTPEPARFQLNIGVAYGSDVDLVTSILLEAAKLHNKVLSTPKSEVQLVDFGNSSIDFVLHFYSFEYYRIEFVKSELRYKIAHLFKERGVVIPFPQRDIWLRNADGLSGKSQED